MRVQGNKAACMHRLLRILDVAKVAYISRSSLMCPQANYGGRSSAEQSPMRRPSETVSAPATPLGAALTGADFRRTPPASADRGRSREAPRRNSLERLNELIGTSSEFGRGASISGGSRASGDIRSDIALLWLVDALAMGYNTNGAQGLLDDTTRPENCHSATCKQR